MLPFAVLLLVLAAGCAPEAPPAAPAAALDSTAAPEAVASFLLDVHRQAVSTRELTRAFPDLDRDTGYRIQRLMMEQEGGADNPQRGWKMGGTRVTQSGAAPDPLYGYSLASHVFPSGTSFPDTLFVDGAPLIEAEVAVWIGRDLPGPEVSREELIEAISGVGGASELVSPRILSAFADGDPPTPAHLVADNVAHAAVVLGPGDTPLAEVDIDAEEAHALIDGREQARGNASAVMGEAPLIDAVLWLANELPRHGLQLSAGDFVITGSLYDNPTLRAGQRAQIVFASFDTLRISLHAAEPTP